MTAPLPFDDGQDETTLWRSLRGGDTAAGDVLAQRYQPLVAKMTGRFAKKLPPFIDRDLVSSAVQAGLLRAMQLFDPELGKSFPSFAFKFMQGRVWDALRNHEPNGRRAVAVYQQREKIAQEMAAAGNPHHDSAIHAMLGTREKTATTFRKTRSLQFVFSTDNTTGREVTLGDLLADAGADVSLHDRDEAIRSALAGLSFDDQILLYCKYWKGATLKNIAAIFGLSESRISQLHAALIERLRERGRERMVALLGDG